MLPGVLVPAEWGGPVGVSAGAGRQRGREEEVGGGSGESAEHPVQEPSEEPPGPLPAGGLRLLAARHQDHAVRRHHR